jgi:hypothetical protein
VRGGRPGPADDRRHRADGRPMAVALPPMAVMLRGWSRAGIAECTADRPQTAEAEAVFVVKIGRASRGTPARTVGRRDRQPRFPPRFSISCRVLGALPPRARILRCRTPHVLSFRSQVVLATPTASGLADRRWLLGSVSTARA